MFGRSKKAKETAINFLTNNLRTQLTVYINTGALIEAIQIDPYIAGYIQGKILSMIAYFVKVKGLASSDANAASGMVLLNVFGQDQAITVSQALKKHGSQRSSQYESGHEKGILIAYYALGAKDAKLDDDYERAIAKYRNAELSLGQNMHLDDHWAAITGLEMLWFGDRMSGY